MLKRTTKENLTDITAMCADSIIGTKVLCYITAYGLERPFLEVWVHDNNGILSAVIVKFYDDITLIANENADTEQLSVFINMSGYNTVCCTHELSRKLGFNCRKIKNGYRYNGSNEAFYADMLTDDDIESAYELICREIPGSFKSGRESYLSFLSDYTFRERRCLARGVCTHSEGNISSVALTSSETEYSAIISGVACDSSFKGKGLGKKTVLSLVSLLKEENKDVFVIALNENAEGFYEHIGFELCEKIAFIERNNDV